MKKVLELTINALVAIAAALLIYQFAIGRINRPRVVAAGDRLPAIEGVTWGDHESNLLLVMRKGCHFCEQSMPFYRQLVALRQQHQTDAYIAAVLPDVDADARGVLDEAKLNVALVSNVALSRLNVTGTSTLILADKRGIVSRVWIGELPPKGEAEVLSALRRRGR